MTFRQIAFLCCFVRVLAPTGIDAQVSVGGVVRDESTAAPVEHVQIDISGRRLRAYTNNDGRFVLEDVPAGRYTLTARRIGYQLRETELIVGNAPVTDYDIDLSPLALRLSEIIVAPGHFGVMEADATATLNLSREEMEESPQIGEDIFRGAQRLPGVASDDISTRLNPRGGTDRELLVMIDGLELYEPYHLKDWDGVLGLIDVHSIGSIDLSTGGFSAEYGNRLTGVLDMRSRPAPVTGARTTLGLSIMNASVMSQGTFNGGNGEWLFSARRGYLDIVLALTDSDNQLSPQYYDAFGNLKLIVHPNHRLTANILYGNDNLSVNEDNAVLDTGWRSSYGWVTWEATPSPAVTARTIAWIGRVTRHRLGDVDLSANEDNSSRTAVDDNRVFSFAGVRHDAGFELSDRFMIKVGGEWKLLGSDYDYFRATRSPTITPTGFPAERMDTVAVNLNPEGHEASAYLSARFRPVAPLTAEVGVRYDHVSYSDDNDLSPRVLSSFELTPATTLRASWGTYHQPHGLHELEVGDGETTFFPADRAEQLALGLEHRWANDVQLRLEAYRRIITDERPRYTNATWSVEAFYEAEGDRVRINPTRGAARGIEASLARDLGSRWAWSVSYVLAVAEDEINGKWVPRRLDQRHALGLDVGFRPNDGWQLSWAWRFHTGWPTTETLFAVDTLADGSARFRREYGELHAERLPAYHRLDFRVTRTLQLGRSALQVYVDLFNFYNRTNLRSWDYGASLNNGVVTVTRYGGQELLPLLPSVGFRYEF